MENLLETIVKACQDGLERLSRQQTPHNKIIYCHEEQWDIPDNLIIKCKRCGRSVDTIPNEIYISFSDPGRIRGALNDE